MAYFEYKSLDGFLNMYILRRISETNFKKLGRFSKETAIEITGGICENFSIEYLMGNSLNLFPSQIYEMVFEGMFEELSENVSDGISEGYSSGICYEFL